MAHAQKPDFFFLRNGRVHLNRQGRQFSRLLAAEVCASAVVMLDTPCSEVVWRVLATHTIRQFPLHFPSRASPCAITFQLDSTTNLVHPKYLDCSALLLVLAWFVFICLYPDSHILFYYEALYMAGRGHSCAEQSVRKGVDRSDNTYTQTSAAHCSMCLQITGQILLIDTKSSGGETDSILAWHAISHPDRHASLALFSGLPKQLFYSTNPWQYNTKV